MVDLFTWRKWTSWGYLFLGESSGLVERDWWRQRLLVPLSALIWRSSVRWEWGIWIIVEFFVQIKLVIKVGARSSIMSLSKLHDKRVSMRMTLFLRTQTNCAQIFWRWLVLTAKERKFPIISTFNVNSEVQPNGVDTSSINFIQIEIQARVGGIGQKKVGHIPTYYYSRGIGETWANKRTSGASSGKISSWVDGLGIEVNFESGTGTHRRLTRSYLLLNKSQPSRVYFCFSKQLSL